MVHRRILMLLALPATFVMSSFLLSTDKELTESIKRGELVYIANCINCHMDNGNGMEGAFPPLAQSDYLMADTHRAIKQIKNGVEGEMTVNGVTYYGMMPAQNLNEKEIADVMNYIRNSWGNTGKVVTVDDVKAALK
jgi:mono/diheme cytochrome c family protein